MADHPNAALIVADTFRGDLPGAYGSGSIRMAHLEMNYEVANPLHRFMRSSTAINPISWLSAHTMLRAKKGIVCGRLGSRSSVLEGYERRAGGGRIPKMALS